MVFTESVCAHQAPGQRSALEVPQGGTSAHGRAIVRLVLGDRAQGRHEDGDAHQAIEVHDAVGQGGSHDGGARSVGGSRHPRDDDG